MATDPHAEVTWNGSLMEGSGRIGSTTSGLLASRELTWRARAEDVPAGPSPEDLIAAAHARLLRDGTRPRPRRVGNACRGAQASATVTSNRARG